MIVPFRPSTPAALAAAGLGLGTCALLAAVGGAAVDQALATIVDGALGSAYATGVTVNKAIPLILAALSFVVAARAGQLNIGIEGQLYAGAVAAIAVGTGLDLPPGLHLAVAVVCGAAGGALWALLPALLLAWRDVSEIVSSLLLNYVAILLTSLLLTTVLGDSARTYPESERVAVGAAFPALLPGTAMSSAVLPVLLLVAAIAITLRRTTFGFEMTAVGSNPRASRLTGIRVERVRLTAFVLSGAVAGLAGAFEVLGNQFRLVDGFSPGWGYSGIMVALLGGLSPTGALLAGSGIAVLSSGADELQRTLGVPSAIAVVAEVVAVLVYVAVVNRPHVVLPRAVRPGSETSRA